ncbi:MAG: HypC/HybG/HupF family hydrogenase formation chaperone [Propionibacteriaceae bacterium]|jgi:hydrogenase expression/formation protein HypC|nr:HypC/HybG/HupF family hydrogenase formation chaperone [Propionibacteriaceae bacterium]
MCFAIPGRILTIDESGDAPFAEVDFAGEQRRVCLSFLPDLTVGEHIIVHAGYALSRVAPEQLPEVMAALAEAGVVDGNFAVESSLPLSPESLSSSSSSPASMAATTGDVIGVNALASLGQSDNLTSFVEAGAIGEQCITCSDEGVPATVLEYPVGPFDLAAVEIDGVVDEVDVMVVGDVVPGDRILVHAGSAIAILEPDGIGEQDSEMALSGAGSSIVAGRVDGRGE